MTQVNIYNLQGDVVGEMDLSDDIFGIEPNEDLLYRSVKMQLGNARQGTQSAKTRAEVRGGGRKPWRQKGTGRARHGSIRSPIWVGGGVTFAPKPRSYRSKLNKKMRRSALKSALSSKAQEAKILVVEDFDLPEAKTKALVEALRRLQVEQGALLVVDEANNNLRLASRNVPELKATYVGMLNVYDILRHDFFVMTRAAAEKIQEVYA